MDDGQQDSERWSLKTGREKMRGQFPSLPILPLWFLSSIIGSRTVEAWGSGVQVKRHEEERDEGVAKPEQRSGHACACTSPTHFLSVFSL